jgi:hypothetical protein
MDAKETKETNARGSRNGFYLDHNIDYSYNNYKY